MPTSHWQTCSRGHKFNKSSGYPVCPICWPGRYVDNMDTEFPSELSNPALSALHAANITTLTKLATYTEKEVLKLHGMGPKSMPILKKALKDRGLSFKK